MVELVFMQVASWRTCSPAVSDQWARELRIGAPLEEKELEGRNTSQIADHCFCLQQRPFRVASPARLLSLFYGINSALLALALEVIKDDLQRLILALVGYCVSLALYPITCKSFLARRLYAPEMDEIEDELDYDISKKYDARLKGTPGKTIRNTLVRMRFNSLFIILWLGIAIYLVYALSTTYYLRLLGSNALGFLFLTAIIACVPWVYLANHSRLPLLRSPLRALWARGV